MPSTNNMLGRDDLRAALSNEEFERCLCAQFDEVLRDCGIDDMVREFLALEPEPRFIRAFDRWLKLRAGQLADDDETRLPVTELARQLH